MTLYYGISSIVLGVALYFPVRNFMMTLNVNRQRARLKRDLTDEEAQTLRRKNNVIAGVIAMTFAFAFNKVLMLRIYGGMN